MKRTFIKSKDLKILLLALGGTAMMASCGEKKKEAPAAVEAAPATESTTESTPESAGISFDREDLGPFFDQYLSLQSSLVASEPERARQIAGEMAQMGLEDMPEVSEAVATLAESDQLGQQRAIFFELNKAMVPYLEAHLNSGEIYQQYCPMAFDNTGAFWFSDSEQILNPYFGDAMLRCGKVEKTFGSL